MPSPDKPQHPKPQQNTLFEFFSSVQLALFLLALLALTAIIGTIVPQNAAPEFYAHRYGPGWARFFELLDIEDEETFEKVAAEFESLTDEPL